MHEFLESAGIEYEIRLPANQILQARIADLLKRPVGRPPHYVQRFYRRFRYKTKSWAHPRRVLAKLEWHPGELFPRVGFITNVELSAKHVIAFYKRIKSGPMHATRWDALLNKRDRNILSHEVWRARYRGNGG
jgi:hypothetical protein